MCMEKPNATNAPKENLSQDLFVIRAVLDSMENQIWKQKIGPLKMEPAMHVRKERTQRRRVLHRCKTATNVLLERKTTTRVLRAVTTATIVLKIHIPLLKVGHNVLRV